jgi:DNA invertase Pin-like site-specific DNA recombinase
VNWVFARSHHFVTFLPTNGGRFVKEGIKSMNGNFVAYYRVSTDKQGASGLGLEAQKTAVLDYLNGGKWKLISEYTEVESGKRNDRPQLERALAACRVRGATLIVAKLDRLARNVHFVSTLMESGVEFCAVDFPQANRLTIHILAAVAEHEAECISQRTKAALAAAKARGVVLGGDRGGRAPASARRAALEARQAKARERASDLAADIKDIREGGATSLQAIAEALNARSIAAPRGGVWSATQVSRVVRMIELDASIQALGEQIDALEKRLATMPPDGPEKAKEAKKVTRR